MASRPPFNQNPLISGLRSHAHGYPLSLIHPWYYALSKRTSHLTLTIKLSLQHTCPWVEGMIKYLPCVLACSSVLVIKH